ncbi:MAG: YpdA family putative bacillithiol disulfide reductase [Gemmatimonadota bacterium]
MFVRTAASGRRAGRGEPARVQLLVVGAGPSGLAVGVAARRAGLSCLLLDRGPIVNTIERYPLGMTFFSTPEKLEIGEVPFVVSRDKPSRSEALSYYRRVAEHFDLAVRPYSQVTRLEPTAGGFRVRALPLGRTPVEYFAEFVVLATGRFDVFNPLGAEGEELSKVSHYFREAHVYSGQEVLVVGGGNSAVEAALACWRAGAGVTLTHLFDKFDQGVKPWVLPDIRNRIEEGAVTALWRHRVERIVPEQVQLRDLVTGRERRLANDWVLAMTGYRPDYSLLEGAGAEIGEDGTPLFRAETLETTVPGLYVAGTLAAGLESGKIFIENGRHHGAAIVRHIETCAR